MELIGIGEAARILDLNPSALRYYEERGLITPVSRSQGRRMYDRVQLRRLALVQIMQRLGISLDAGAAMLDRPSTQWRQNLQDQVGVLDELVARAQMARDFLSHLIDCRSEHPAQECEHLVSILDRRLDGTSMEQLANESKARL